MEWFWILDINLGKPICFIHFHARAAKWLQTACDCLSVPWSWNCLCFSMWALQPWFMLAAQCWLMKSLFQSFVDTVCMCALVHGYCIWVFWCLYGHDVRRESGLVVSLNNWYVGVYGISQWSCRVWTCVCLSVHLNVTHRADEVGTIVVAHVFYKFSMRVSARASLVTALKCSVPLQHCKSLLSQSTEEWMEKEWPAIPPHTTSHSHDKALCGENYSDKRHSLITSKRKNTGRRVSNGTLSLI